MTLIHTSKWGQKQREKEKKFSLNNKQMKYLMENLGKKSLIEISKNLDIKTYVLKEFLLEIKRREKLSPGELKKEKKKRAIEHLDELSKEEYIKVSSLCKDSLFYEESMDKNNFWISGIPGTFATSKEAPWKESLIKSVPPASEEKFSGIRLKFKLPTLSPNKQSLDVDNLCEPVFSVIINKLGWFDGKRPNLIWWCGEKEMGKPSGLELSLESMQAPRLEEEFGSPIFKRTFEGELPNKASDPEIPSWLNSIIKTDQPINNDRFAVRLQFGGSKVNIGDIATGKVKSTIDCLYPILGGERSKPEDWRIDTLQVEKNVPNIIEGTVRICIWKKK